MWIPWILENNLADQHKIVWSTIFNWTNAIGSTLKVIKVRFHRLGYIPRDCILIGTDRYLNYGRK